MSGAIALDNQSYTALNPHNDQQYASMLRRVAANARAIITFQVGMPFGCVRMHRLFTWLKPRRIFDFPVFAEYLSAVREFPIGNDRLHWNRAVLFQNDSVLEQINLSFRDRVHNACHDLLALLASETPAV